MQTSTQPNLSVAPAPAPATTTTTTTTTSSTWSMSRNLERGGFMALGVILWNGGWWLGKKFFSKKPDVKIVPPA